MYLSVVVVALLALKVHCEVFTALATLTRALHHEKDLADALRQYVEMEKERLAKIMQ